MPRDNTPQNEDETTTRLRLLEEKYEAMMAQGKQPAANEDATAVTVSVLTKALAQAKEGKSRKRALIGMSGDDDDEEDEDLGTHIHIRTFDSSPQSVSQDVIGLVQYAGRLPSLSLLTTEAQSAYRDSIRISLEPKGEKKSWDKALETVKTIWDPMDHLLPLSDLLYSLVNLAHLLPIACKTQQIGDEVANDVFSFIVDILSRNLSAGGQNYVVLREYAILRYRAFRDRFAAGVKWDKDTLSPFDDELLKDVAGELGVQASSLEGFFVKSAAPGPAQSVWGATVRAGCEKGAEEKIKRLVEERLAIDKRVFERHEAEGRIPVSLVYKGLPKPLGNVNGLGVSTSAGGANGGGAKQGGGAGNGSGGGGSRFGSVGPASTASPSPAPSLSPQQSYAGGKAPQQQQNQQQRNSPYPPRPQNPNVQLYSGSFLYDPSFQKCLFCGGEHSSKDCQSPKLEVKGNDVVSPHDGRAVCRNFNRSVCGAGPSGEGCPRAHCCSQCGDSGHVASRCPA